MSSGNISKATLDYICNQLPTDGEGVTPKQLHIKISSWSRITIQHALRMLCEEGRATYSGVVSRRKYRRVAEVSRGVKSAMYADARRD